MSNYKDESKILDCISAAYEIYAGWDALPEILKVAGSCIHNFLVDYASKRNSEYSSKDEILELSQGINERQFKNISDYYFSQWGNRFQDGEFSQKDAEYAAILYCALSDLECSVKSAQL